jgi:hypothetical protein
LLVLLGALHCNMVELCPSMQVCPWLLFFSGLLSQGTALLWSCNLDRCFLEIPSGLVSIWFSAS